MRYRAKENILWFHRGEKVEEAKLQESFPDGNWVPYFEEVVEPIVQPEPEQESLPEEPEDKPKRKKRRR
jgi:hypothetical protein